MLPGGQADVRAGHPLIRADCQSALSAAVFSPLNHGWTIYDPPGVVSTVIDAGRPGRVLRTTTSQGTGFGIRYPESGELGLPQHQMSVWIKDTNTFYFYVRVRGTNGGDYTIRYQPTGGSPYAYQEYAITPVGTQYKDGAWHELSRDLDADLRAVFGVGVEYVKWFSIRGDYDLDDLVLLGEGEEVKYYFFNGRRVAMRKEGVVQYLLGDHLGTTSVVLDASGTKVAESRHYPYGGERWSSGAMPTDYRWTGQREEQPLGLYHMGARFYDSYLARWLSADTIVPGRANPQSLNRYSYVYNNPMKFVDPTGHKEEGECSFNDEGCEEQPPPIGEVIEAYLNAFQDMIYDPERTEPILIPLPNGLTLVIMPVNYPPNREVSEDRWTQGILLGYTGSPS